MDNNHRILILIWYILFYVCVVVETDSYNCTFDNGFCDWKHVNNNYFQLMWRRQDTTSSSTGPESDHTSGVGSYIYISSSYAVTIKRARLSSPLKSPGKYCLSFWYYMNGRATDILRVGVKENGTNFKMLFRMSNNPKKMWIFATEVFTTTENFTIFIDAIIKENEHDNGYVAVDDVMIFSKQCPQYCTDPTLVFGNEFFGDIWEGSVIHIDVTCIEGYERKGNSSIVCQNNGYWTELPKCQPIDCGKPSLGKGLVDVTPEDTYFNTTIILSCSKGFTLIGSNSITCMGNGNWSILPKCVFNNCSNPTPTSGNVSSTNFQVGSRVEVTCATGYRLIGNKVILCNENSTWSDSPACERIECPRPILTKGFLEPNGTTWYPNQFLILACAGDYTLRGNATITCLNNGNWPRLPTCYYNEDSDTDVLTAVAVTVPLVVIVILGITLVFVCRKRKRLCKKKEKTHEHDENSQRKTNGSRGLRTNYTNVCKSLRQVSEYAVLSNENKSEMKDVVYYNNSKQLTDIGKNIDFENMNKPYEPVSVNTNTHIKGNKTVLKKKESIDDFNNKNQNQPIESVKQNEIMPIEKQGSNVDRVKAACDQETKNEYEELHIKTPHFLR